LRPKTFIFDTSRFIQEVGHYLFLESFDRKRPPVKLDVLQRLNDVSVPEVVLDSFDRLKNLVRVHTVSRMVMFIERIR